jgi:hypothetical protein
MIRETEDCTIAATGQPVVEAIAEGELKPEIGVAKLTNLNGTSAERPSKVHFGTATCPGGGVLCPLHSTAGGEGTWVGTLQYLGYNDQELITVRP